MVKLELTSKGDARLRERMVGHYSQPRGFVGRSLCYAVLYNGVYYGHIVAGSATRFLPGRNEFFGITKRNIGGIVNNTFYSVSPVSGRYPIRNFTTAVVVEFRRCVTRHWPFMYDDDVIGFETLVELPRTGELYKRDGWVVCGTTKGFTCKRVAGLGMDGWTGQRVWNTTDLRPKLVLVRRI